MLSSSAAKTRQRPGSSMNWQCHPWNVKLDHRGQEIWLMEEIRLTTLDFFETLEIMDNGINYQPQLRNHQLYHIGT